MTAAAGALDTDGRVWCRKALADADLARLDGLCATGDAPGARLAWSREMAQALSDVTRLADEFLPGARPVRLV